MIGQRISGRYQIIESIGGGGMANVYKALDVILDRHVAVKVLQPQFSEDEQFINRFRREAQAATSLAHPNVVSIFDVGEEGNIYYIVMEYVEGQTLKELIQSKGPLSVKEIVDYGEQMLSALAHAHANHLIHRDIKPHNILIRHDGVLKVTDFGIARAISAATITHTNTVMGSVHYLSPEQARGGHVTYKSDIYSLGIVLYEMATGKLPFSGDTAVSIALKHLQSEVPPVKKLNPSIPQSIENMIRKATVKDPIKRYESVQDMEEDLATALQPERLNESPFVFIDDEHEATKAIPVIRDIPTTDEVDQTVVVAPSKEGKVTSIDQEKKEPVETVKKKNGKSKKWMSIIVLTLGLLLASTIGAVAFLPDLFKVNEVQVPDVTELSFEEAEEMLTELNLAVERIDIHDDVVPIDEVIRQHPLANSMVKEHSTVRLHISMGPSEVELSDYRGLPIDLAESQLKDLNFKVEREPKPTNDATSGVVLSQNPPQGSLVIPEETTVYLTYSVVEQIELRDLKGRTEDYVRQYLTEVGLVGHYDYQYSNEVTPGAVLEQSPNAFTLVEKGDVVRVVISEGKEPVVPTEPHSPDQVGQQETPSEAKQEPTKLFEVRQKVDLEDSDQEAGLSFDIRIVYRDVTTNGEDKVFIEDTISEKKSYVIPLEVSPTQSGSFEVFVNNELAHTSKTYSY